MSSGRKVVGFDRKLELSWLDVTAAQIAAGATTDELHAYLWEMLDGSVSAGSSGFNSDRGKTVTVLKRVWCLVPEDLIDLRDRAVKELSEVDASERIAIHWAMCMATYPFFRDVASTIGRLIALQGQVTLAEARRRLAEQWGDRDIVRRASQRIIRSFVAWGVLREAGVRGRFAAPANRGRVSASVSELLFVAALVGEDGIELRRLEQHAALFPFETAALYPLALSAHCLRVERQGFDRDVVVLA